jgi:diguanylate cyclase (GGDEF)-like protein
MKQKGKPIIDNLMTGRLLLAEKSPHLSKVIKDQLEAQEFEVHIATTESEIFNILKNKNPHLALVDLEIIKSSNSDLCFKMKRFESDAFLPILILLETRELEDELVRMKILYDEFIMVPVNYIELLAKIHGLMRIKKLQDNLIMKNKALEVKSHELEDVNRKLFELNDISKKIYSTLNTSEILQILMSKIPSLFNSALCSFFFYNTKDNSLQIGVHNHQPSSIPADYTINANNSIFFKDVISNRKSRLIKDVEKELGLKNKSKYKSKSFMNLVIKNGNEVIGLLNLNDKHDSREFTNEDFILALSFADNLSAALINAKLFENAMELSIRDGLTGLFNRRFFQDKLKEEIERAKRYKTPLSLIFSDIDDFKHFNDQFGHQIGDLLLQEISLIMYDNSRDIDTAARYGGEEIVLLLPQTNMKSARVLSQRIIDKIRNFSLVLDENKIGVTVSMGIAEYIGGIELDVFIKRADSALNIAKKSGKNRIIEWSQEKSE